MQKQCLKRNKEKMGNWEKSGWCKSGLNQIYLQQNLIVTNQSYSNKQNSY